LEKKITFWLQNAKIVAANIIFVTQIIYKILNLLGVFLPGRVLDMSAFAAQRNLLIAVREGLPRIIQLVMAYGPNDMRKFEEGLSKIYPSPTIVTEQILNQQAIRYMMGRAMYHETSPLTFAALYGHNSVKTELYKAGARFSVPDFVQEYYWAHAEYCAMVRFCAHYAINGLHDVAMWNYAGLVRNRFFCFLN